MSFWRSQQSPKLCIVQTEKRAKELKQTNVGGKLVLVGKKGITYFNRRSDIYNIAGNHKC